MPRLLMAAGSLVALGALLPLGFVVVYSVIIGPSQAWDLLIRPRVGELLTNTLGLAGACTASCVVLGVGLAWAVERTDVPMRALWHGLMVAPLAIPAFVNSYSWATLVDGVVGFRGALLVITLSYFPLVYLPVVAALRGLDPAWEETAHSLGQGSTASFFTVVLPQLRPAVLGGALLVSLHLLAEFGALQMLQFPTFTTAIYDQYGSTFNGQAANMLAGVLVLICLVILVGELRLRGRRRYARVSRGAARRQERVHLGVARVPVLLALVGVAAAAVGLPAYSLIHWTVVGSSTTFHVADLAAAAGTSLGLGAVAALVTVALAMPAAWLAVRHPGAASHLVERSTYIANALPGIVVALALVTVSIRVAQPIYQTFPLLVMAYAIMFLPRAVVSVRAALEQAPVMLDDVAHSLGATQLGTVGRVTLPLIAPGVAAGAALVFLAVSTELTATLMLSPIGTETLATRFWSESSAVAFGAAAPYAMALVLISIPAAILLGRQARWEHAS